MRRFVPQTILLATILAASGYRVTSTAALAQTADPANQIPYQMKVTSNLVVVRVVVRDVQDKPIPNLKKEDFRLFDRGKQQSISQFAAETPAQSSGPTPALPNGQPASAVLPGPGLPQRFVALYFDDLNMSDGDIIQARDAADRFLAANLKPNDRVGLYTSGNSLSDFTGDPKQIHDALRKLHVSPVALRNHDCPDISDYQAQQITEFDDEQIDAWVKAIDQALHDQRCSQVPGGPGEPQRYIAVLARRVLEQSELQSRATLQELEKVVDYVARMPGQRTVVLISPGFQSRGEQSDLDRIIEHALRAEVVMSSLDPRGNSKPMLEADASHAYLPLNGDALSATHRLDEERESAAQDVLQEVAQGTGGEFVHNTNDLQAGFSRLAGVPAYYLGFAPTDIKADGKFHTLKVELAEKHPGFTVQARRGYFAPRSEAEAGTSAEQGAATDTDAQVKEQIREAVYTNTDLQQLPLTMDVKVFATKTEDRELVAIAHVDTKSLHLPPSGNKLTVVSAVFDQKDNLVKLQRGEARLEVSDAGMKMDSTFELKPGTYRVREIVTDAQEHRMAALSREVNVTLECCASRDLASPKPVSAPPPIRTVPGSPLTAEVATTYLDYPLRKLRAALPILNGMKPDDSPDELPRILSRAGEATVNSLASIPNLTSLEDVYSVLISRDAAPANSILGIQETPALLDIEAQLRESRSIEFNYLLLFDHHADGATAIRELRTDFKNRQVGSSFNQVTLHGFGFAYQWLLLTPANQSELRFRYFGKQTIDNHQTFVLGFVQIPGQVKLPAKYQWANQETPFFLQGIAWIDQSSYEVVRLRTDLLSPLPGVHLDHLTTDLHFSAVRIHGYDAAFWLPSEVLIQTVRSDSIFEELHQYSRYRFFHAESKLLP